MGSYVRTHLVWFQQWKEDYKSMKSRMDKCKGNESNAWALIYDQCSAELKNKLEGTQDYDTAKSGNNVAKLLKMFVDTVANSTY